MIADLPLPFAPLMKVMWRLRTEQACHVVMRRAVFWLCAVPGHTCIHSSGTGQFVFNLISHHAVDKVCHRCFGRLRAISQASFRQCQIPLSPQRFKTP